MNVIALVVGELTAYLTANKDDFRRGVNEAKRDLDSLARDAERQATATDNRSSRIVSSAASAMATVNRDAEKQGREAGGKLSQGISQGLIRNSPLIVAGAAAALTVGAPAMLAAATGLFAGIGIIAAAQSEKVGHAWSTTWSGISSTTIKAASVIEPVLVRVADNVGDSFQRMAPMIAQGFAAAAPQIEVFADGITDLAENAMPGLVRAVERGMPVTQGLADFMAKIGTGLSDFFDRISEHSGAAGDVFSQLGDTMATLLPILGELLGQGAELAADVLPLLNSSLGLVLNVVNALGPALPIIVQGFMAMKIAQSVTGWIGGLGGALDSFAKKTGTTSLASGRLGTTLSTIGKAAPLVGIGIGLIGAAYAKGEEEADGFSQRLAGVYARMREGGTAAANARNELEFLGEATSRVGNGFGTFGLELPDRMDDAAAASKRLWDEMTPLERATSLVDSRTRDLSAAVAQYGQDSPQATSAAAALTSAQMAQEAASSDLELAITGVTEAMLAQADAALALADSDLAHRQAIDQAEDSYAAMNEAIRDHGAASEEASDAAMAWEADLSRIVATAGKLASDTLPANMDANSKLALSQIAQRDQLRELAAMYGENLPVALQQALASLEQTTAGYDLAKLEADRLAAATGTASEKMQKLGATTATPKIKGDAADFDQKDADTTAKLQQLNSMQAVPKAKLDSSAFAGTHAQTMGQIGQLAAQRPTPAVSLADYASGGISKVEQKLLGLRDRTIYITTVERTVKGKAGGGAIGLAGGGGVFGPGGPTDDLIPALGPAGSRYMLSNGEHVLDAADVRLLGGQGGVYAFRQALNDRKVQTVTPVGLAGGGAVTPTAGTGNRTVGDLHVHLHGTVDFGDRNAMRKAADVLYERFREKERSLS